MTNTIYVNGVERTEAALVRDVYGAGMESAMKVAAGIADAVDRFDLRRGREVLRDTYVLALEGAKRVTGIDAEGLAEAALYLSRPITLSSSAKPLENFKRGLLGAAAATAMLM